MHKFRRIGRGLGISSDSIAQNRSLGGGNSWKLGGKFSKKWSWVGGLQLGTGEWVSKTGVCTTDL